MHAVFELVEHEMIFCFHIFSSSAFFFGSGKRILGNKAEEMKLNFNLFLWPALFMSVGIFKVAVL